MGAQALHGMLAPCRPRAGNLCPHGCLSAPGALGVRNPAMAGPWAGSPCHVASGPFAPKGTVFHIRIHGVPALWSRGFGLTSVRGAVGRDWGGTLICLHTIWRIPKKIGRRGPPCRLPRALSVWHSIRGNGGVWVGFVGWLCRGPGPGYSDRPTRPFHLPTCPISSLPAKLPPGVLHSPPICRVSRWTDWNPWQIQTPGHGLEAMPHVKISAARS